MENTPGIPDKTSEPVKAEALEPPNAALSFVASLFDFSFSSFVATDIVRVLYILSIVGTGLICLFSTLVAFSVSVGFGLIHLILSPLFFFVYVAIARVSLEMVIVVFQIAASLKSIDAKTE